VSAVGGDEMARVHMSLLARTTVRQGGLDSIVVLARTDEFGTEGNGRRRCFETSQQQRSRRDCGVHDGRVGLTTAASASDGYPRGITTPSLDVNVRVTTAVGSTSAAPARTAPPSPIRRINSVPRVLVTGARDRFDSPSRCSTTNTSNR
jgi:hypothetical protein